MAVNYSSKYSSAILVWHRQDGRHVSMPKQNWQPVQYTSLFWWYVLNYGLLALLLSLPMLIYVGVK